MPQKISKRDQDPAEERAQRARDAERSANAPRCTHFEVGTFVIWFEEGLVGSRRKRAEVIARPGDGSMTVQHEDQTTEILYPQALAFESKMPHNGL